MDVGIGLLAALARGLANATVALVGSPLRIDVLEGEDRLQVLREAQPPPKAIPRWVPGDANTPPATDMFDAQNLHLSIEDVARTQRWLPVDWDRIVLHVYNKSDDAVFFRKVVAKATVAAVRRPWRGSVIQFGGGGTVAKTFGLSVGLYMDRPCPVSVNLDVSQESVTSRMYQLSPRESLYLIVDAAVGIDETAIMLDWWLWFELDANRGLRSGRRARVPGGRKYLIGPRRSFRIANGADAPKYFTRWDGEGFTFTWERWPPVSPAGNGEPKR